MVTKTIEKVLSGNEAIDFILDYLGRDGKFFVRDPDISVIFVEKVDEEDIMRLSESGIVELNN